MIDGSIPLWETPAFEAPTLEDARAVLRAQPFSDLVGAELTSFGEGRAVLEILVRDDHLQQAGLVHGGLIAYAADNAVTFAGGLVLGPAVVTASLAIDYVEPAQGDRLVADARVAHHTPRRAVCHCEVRVRTSSGWATCAVAQGQVVLRRGRST